MNGAWRRRWPAARKVGLRDSVVVWGPGGGEQLRATSLRVPHVSAVHLSASAILIRRVVDGCPPTTLASAPFRRRRPPAEHRAMLPAVWSAPHTPKTRRERQEISNFLRLTDPLSSSKAANSLSPKQKQERQLHHHHRHHDFPSIASISGAGVRLSHSSPRLLQSDDDDWSPTPSERSRLNRRRGALTRFSRSHDDYISEVMPLSSGRNDKAIERRLGRVRPFLLRIDGAH
uniref:Uncharacterized protein n=1 Tax=Plectus sambesii TaxID=2011161 RepID=A0A914VYR4_9BILA